MKTIISTIAMVVISISSFGQGTWSKEYDLGEGRKNFLRNIVLDDKGMIYTSSWQFCPTQESNTFLECSVLSKYNKTGDFIKEIVYDSTAGVENGNTLLLKEELLHISALNTDSLGKYYQIAMFDKDLNQKLYEVIEFNDEFYAIISGVRQIENEVFIYGTLVNYDFSQTNAFFAKLDDSLNVEIINKYPARQLNVYMNDLQATPDGNLAFILKQRGPANPTGWPGYEIYKVDHSGQVIDSFVFKEGFGLDWPFSLTIDIDGNYYFFSDKHPINGFPASIGRINKLNKDMKTLEWSVILPNSTFGRQYRIEESLLAQNGDIIVCGSMQDFLTFENSPDHVNTGFITRLDQEGNIIWHHIYKVPNEEYLPQSEYGRYRFSQLNKIVELEDGTILAGGNHAYHWTVYDHPDFDDSKETNLLWLLKVDADGCLEGEECDEVIEIGRGTQSKPVFAIGTKWTYDFSWQIPGGPVGLDSLILGTYELTITDTFRRNDSLISVINNNRYPNNEEWMYQDGEQIFLWKGDPVGWQLTYDFGSNQTYHSKYFNPFVNKLDTAIVNIEIDPSQSIDFSDRGIQSVQNLSIDNNGTYQDMPVTADILNLCGKLYGGLSLGLGLSLADPPYIIGDLRCFEQGDFSFNFTGSITDSSYLACDSVSYYTSTIDEKINSISITPNPFFNNLNLSINHTKPLEGEILDIRGGVVKTFDISGGKTNSKIELEALLPNTYIVVIKNTSGQVLYQEQVIKIN